MTVEKLYIQNEKESKAMLEFAGFAEVATEENGGLQFMKMKLKNRQL